MAAQLKPLLDSIKAAVDHENWLAGLALTLMLPDVCAKIETPNEFAGQRYARWWDDYFKDTYEYNKTPSLHVKGEEVDQLRCSYFHEGRYLQAHKNRISATIEKFQFVSSNDHLKQHGATVMLNVKEFCLEMCSIAKKWEDTVLSNDSEMLKRADDLAEIYVVLGVSVAAETVSSAAALGTLRKDSP